MAQIFIFKILLSLFTICTAFFLSPLFCSFCYVCEHFRPIYFFSCSLSWLHIFLRGCLLLLSLGDGSFPCMFCNHCELIFSGDCLVWESCCPGLWKLPSMVLSVDSVRRPVGLWTRGWCDYGSKPVLWFLLNLCISPCWFWAWLFIHEYFVFLSSISVLWGCMA